MIVYDYDSNITHSLDKCSNNYYTNDSTTKTNDMLMLNIQDINFDINTENNVFHKLLQLGESSNNDNKKYIIADNESIHNILSILNAEKHKDIMTFDNQGYLIQMKHVKLLEMYNKQRKFTLPILKQLEILKHLNLINEITIISVPSKNELNEQELVKLIKLYINSDNKVYIIPNEGNGGDAFIALGTYHFLKKHNINYKIIQDNNTITKNDKLIYSGGGNLVSHYMHCEHFLRSFENNEILILPHTIDKVKLLQELKNNVTIITRDVTSYYNCQKHFKHNSYISHDMAFYINLSWLPEIKQTNNYKSTNCFRNDVERTVINIPNNIDISDRINYDRYMKNEQLVEKTVFDILSYLMNFKVIKTNRLHVCIAGYLLQKQVEFHRNSYWKNCEVFKYSLTHSELIKFNHIYKRKRVALCFRGAMDKIRNGHYSKQVCDIYESDSPYVPFETVKTSLTKHLFDINPDYEFDIFIHCWNKDIKSKMEQLYQPKRTLYENNKDYENIIKKDISKNFAYTSQQLSICKSLKLMIEYAEEHNVEYDYVISYRPDGLLYKDLHLKKYENDNVYVNSNIHEDFHFIMSYNNATMFKNMFGSKKTVPQFVQLNMKKKLVADDIVCGKDQEILRKIKYSCVDKGYKTLEFFHQYGLTNEQINTLTHI